MRDQDLEHPSIGNPPADPEIAESQAVVVCCLADLIKRNQRCLDVVGSAGCGLWWCDMNILAAAAKGDGPREYRVCKCGWAWYLDEGDR